MLAKYRAFSSSVKESSVNKMLGDGDHVRAHDPRIHGQIDLLLQWLNGRRELLEAVPIPGCTALHFDNVLVDRLDNIPRTFHYHV